MLSFYSYVFTFNISWINNNRLSILFSIGAIITVGPAAIISLGIPFIDLVMLFNKNMR